ncbi:MAG: guanylate kinase, partial [Solirubrobacterales bacterium]
MAKLFVITGPSGVGKGTLIKALRAELPDLALSISATTR